MGMKKIILLSFAILFAFSSNAQIVNIPDSVFKAYLVGDTLINTNLDTEIQVSEAASYTGGIGILYLFVSDLTGIEAFTSLTQLYCVFTQITFIDVSNNSALLELHCEHNQMTTLNVSNCTSLKKLECYDNQITALDLNNCISLVSLDCCTNHLTSLDLGNCPVFNSLQCCTNQLTSLNIKNGNNHNFVYFHTPFNPNLFCIEVDDPVWSTTNWTDKDSIAVFSDDCSNNVSEIPVVIDLKVAPNPFSTSTIISFDKTYQSLDLSIIDLQGKIIQQKSYHDCNKITLNRAGIANGFYFLRLTLDGKYVETKKIVVAD